MHPARPQGFIVRVLPRTEPDSRAGYLRPMRSAILILLFVLTSGSRTLADDGEARAWRLIRDHRLLTAKQLTCTFLLTREPTSRRKIIIGVYEKHNKRCGGDPDITHRLFDFELDLRSGKARWDRDNGFDMNPIPRRG